MATVLARLRDAILLCCLGALAACAPGRFSVPPPQTPQLEAVNFLGQRVCPSYTTSQTQFSFSCAPLPTSEGTGWLITPLRKPHPTNANWSLVNHGVVMVVSGPSLSAIEVGYWTAGPRRIVLSQVPQGPARPYLLVQGGPGEVEVAAADDGTRKVWRISVNTDSCSEQLRMDVVNISGGVRSDALPVTFVRAADERGCFPTTATGTLPPGAGDGFAFGGMGPSSPPPTGACPGGGSRTLFHFCESCSFSAGSTLVYPVSLESCSLSDARNSIASKPNCTVRQVASSGC